jgi:putative membrane protein
MKTKLFIGLISCGLMLNVACEPQGDRDPVKEARDINKDREQVENQDSKVLTESASMSMLNLELSNMAEERAVTPEAKELARELKQEHSEINQELLGIAQRKQIALPTDLSDDHRGEIEDLTDKEGLDFDRDFVDKVISVHKDKIDDYESLSRDSDDPEIREFAINMLPKLRIQLENAERVENQLNQRDNDGQAFGGEGGGVFDDNDERRYDEDIEYEGDDVDAMESPQDQRRRDPNQQPG